MYLVAYFMIVLFAFAYAYRASATTSPVTTRSENAKGSTELVSAAFEGNLVRVRELLQKGAAIDGAFNSDPKHLSFPDGGYPTAGKGWTALHAACAAGHSEIVGFLLETGANPNADDGLGGTPLLELFNSSLGDADTHALVKMFLNRGVHINVRVPKYLDGVAGQTPLALAARKNLVDTVQLLIDHNADPTIEDDAGSTPRDQAVLFEADRKIIAVLVEAEGRWKSKERH